MVYRSILFCSTFRRHFYGILRSSFSGSHMNCQRGHCWRCHTQMTAKRRAKEYSPWTLAVKPELYISIHYNKFISMMFFSNSQKPSIVFLWSASFTWLPSYLRSALFWSCCWSLCISNYWYCIFLHARIIRDVACNFHLLPCNVMLHALNSPSFL